MKARNPDSIPELMHLSRSMFPRAERDRAPEQAPTVEESPWGAELVRHEREKQRVNRTFFPWED